VKINEKRDPKNVYKFDTRYVRKIETSGGLGQRWRTPNNWEKDEGE